MDMTVDENAEDMSDAFAKSGNQAMIENNLMNSFEDNTDLSDKNNNSRDGGIDSPEKYIEICRKDLEKIYEAVNPCKEEIFNIASNDLQLNGENLSDITLKYEGSSTNGFDKMLKDFKEKCEAPLQHLKDFPCLSGDNMGNYGSDRNEKLIEPLITLSGLNGVFCNELSKIFKSDKNILLAKDGLFKAEDCKSIIEVCNSKKDVDQFCKITEVSPIHSEF